MRLILLAALALLPGPALAQFYPYGVTTYPGVGQTPSYGGYGAAPGAGIGGYGYNGYSGGAYGTGPGYGGYGGYGANPGYGNAGYGGYDPNQGYNPNAVGSAYAVPGSQNGIVRTPDDIMTLGRTRTDSNLPGSPGGPNATRAPDVALPGAVAAVERPDPKGRRFEGIARVIDGNTMAVSGEVIVLDGADAPELGQTCTDKSGLEWRCGDRARSRLVSLAEGRRLVCTGKSLAGTAVVASCMWGTTDLGRAMVADGWAMAPKAVSPLYVADEAAARADGRGIWAGTLQAPWTYRGSH